MPRLRPTSTTTAHDRLGEATRAWTPDHGDSSLGRYLVGVDQEVRMAWILPLEMRALGIQGTSEVTFIVDSKGRVQEKYLSRRSGRTELDALALAAVPKRLDRMPDDLKLDSLTVRYTFRTTDTLIAGSR